MFSRLKTNSPNSVTNSKTISPPLPSQHTSIDAWPTLNQSKSPSSTPSRCGSVLSGHVFRDIFSFDVLDFKWCTCCLPDHDTDKAGSSERSKREPQVSTAAGTSKLPPCSASSSPPPPTSSAPPPAQSNSSVHHTHDPTSAAPTAAATPPPSQPPQATAVQKPPSLLDMTLQRPPGLSTHSIQQPHSTQQQQQQHRHQPHTDKHGSEQLPEHIIAH